MALCLHHCIQENGVLWLQGPRGGEGEIICSLVGLGNTFGTLLLPSAVPPSISFGAFMRHTGSVSYSMSVHLPPFSSPHFLPSKDAESTNLFIDGYFHIPITDAEYKGGLWAEPIKFGPSQVCQSELLMYGNMCVYRMSTTRKYIHGWKYHSYSIFDSEVAFSVPFFSLRSSMAEALNRRPRLFTTAAAHNNIKGTYWWLAYH